MRQAKGTHWTLLISKKFYLWAFFKWYYRGMKDYYTDLNRRIVQADQIKKNGQAELRGNDGRVRGHAGLGHMY